MLRTIFLAKTKCLQGILKKLVMQNKLNHIVTSHVICSKNAMFNVFQPQKKSKTP